MLPANTHTHLWHVKYISTSVAQASATEFVHLRCSSPSAHQDQTPQQSNTCMICLTATGNSVWQSIQAGSASTSALFLCSSRSTTSAARPCFSQTQHDKLQISLGCAMISKLFITMCNSTVSSVVSPLASHSFVQPKPRQELSDTRSGHCSKVRRVCWLHFPLCAAGIMPDSQRARSCAQNQIHDVCSVFLQPQNRTSSCDSNFCPVSPLPSASAEPKILFSPSSPYLKDLQGGLTAACPNWE